MIANDLFNKYLRCTNDDVVQSNQWFSDFRHNNARFQEDLNWSLVYFEMNTDLVLYAWVYGDMLTYNKKSHSGPLLLKLIANKTSTIKQTNRRAIIAIVKIYQIKTSCKGVLFYCRHYRSYLQRFSF